MSNEYSKSTRHHFPANYYLYLADYDNGYNLTPTPHSRSFTWNDTLNGSKLPDWRDRVRTHSNATTALTARSQRMTSSPQSYHLETVSGYAGQPPTQIGGYSNNGPLTTVWFDFQDPPAMPQHVVNAANQGWYKKLRKAQTAISGGVVLGELRETLQMIRNPAKGIRRRLDEYLSKSKKISKVNKTRRAALGAMSDAYLQTVFGILPLANDVKDGMTYLDRKAEKILNEYEDINYSYKEQALLYDGVDNERPAFQPQFSGKITDQVIYDYQVINRGQVRHMVSPSSSPDWTLLGLNPWQDFVPTIWELIPYSFVVDYFTNIGDVLDAYSVGTSGIAWCSTTHRRKCTRKVTFTISHEQVRARIGWSYLSSTSEGDGASTFEVKLVDRYPSGLIERPSLSWELPGFGSRKWINLGALATNHGLALGAFKRLK